MSDKTRCFRCGATISDDNARKLASMCCACGDAPDPRDAEITRLRAECEDMRRRLQLAEDLRCDTGSPALQKILDERDEARAELTRLRLDLAASHGGEPDDLLAGLDQARADLAEEKEHSKRLDVALMACEEQIGHSREIKQHADRMEWERNNIASINARIYPQLDAARADLAAAQKREDARKAWREKYAERCETRGGDVQGCGTWIHYRDVLDAIGRGEGPK